MVVVDHGKRKLQTDVTLLAEASAKAKAARRPEGLAKANLKAASAKSPAPGRADS